MPRAAPGAGGSCGARTTVPARGGRRCGRSRVRPRRTASRRARAYTRKRAGGKADAEVVPVSPRIPAHPATQVCVVPVYPSWPRVWTQETSLGPRMRGDERGTLAAGVRHLHPSPLAGEGGARRVSVGRVRGRVTCSGSSGGERHRRRVDLGGRDRGFHRQPGPNHWIKHVLAPRQERSGDKDRDGRPMRLAKIRLAMIHIRWRRVPDDSLEEGPQAADELRLQRSTSAPSPPRASAPRAWTGSCRSG